MTPGKSRKRQTGSMSRHQKFLVGIAIAFLLYSIAGFMVLPVLLKNILEKKLTENLNRPVSIETIQVNPYVFKITVNNFQVGSRDDDEHFIGFERLFVDLESASIFKRALVIKSLILSGPSINLARYKDSTYNFSDLIVSTDNKEEKESKPFLFSLNNIEIKNGSIVFADEPKEATHRVSDLNISVPFLSNVRHDVEINVKPAFSAIVNDTPVNMTGMTIPFHDTRRTVFNIRINRLNIPEYLAYLPNLGNLTLKSGKLDIKAVLGFEMQPGNIPALTLSGALALHGIDVAEMQGESYLTIPQVDLKLLDSKPLEKNFHLANITISKPEFLLRRKNDGTISPLDFLPEPQESETPESETDQQTPLELLVDEIALNSGTVHFDDQANSEPFTTTLYPLAVKISNLSTLEDAEAPVDISLQTEAEESVAINGALSLNPMEVHLHVTVQELQIPRFRPYYQENITPEVEDGRLDLAADLQFSKEDAGDIIRADNIGGQLSSLAVNDKDGESLITIPSLSIAESSLDMTDRRIVVGDFSGSAGKLHLVRQQDGIINLTRLLEPAPEKTKTETAEADSTKEWTATLEKGDISGFSVIFTDNTLAEPTTIPVDKIRLTAEDISTVEGSSGKVNLDLLIDRKANLSITGPLGVMPLSASLTLNLEGLPVKTIQPYFSDKVNLVISDGAISADGQLEVTSGEHDALSTQFQGNARIADLASFDPVAGEEFLKWQELSLTGMDYDSDRSSFRIDKINWHNFYNKIAVFEDGGVNLKAVLKKTGEPETDIPEKSVPEPAGEEESPFLIEINTVSLKKGQFDFLDRSIKPHYSTNLSDIAGTITGLSSQAGVTAEADITGKLDKHAPLHITGKVNPLSKELFADLAIDFKDIELSPTSPYTGKFIGYTVSKGKLSLDLQYLVEGSKLSGKNKAFLDQFTLGETVKSPDSLNLPIKLAISLLRNRKGEITVNVPVKGDLDDPEFRIGGIVFKAIISLIAKAATSPFALLGALIPEGKDLQHVDFVPGSSQLGDEYAEKLDTIAKVLYDRPGLKMDIAGSFNAVEEREVLHEMRFEQLLKNEKFKDLSKKKDETASLDEITVEPEEYETYLKKAYKEADIEKPKNIFGFAKKLPPEEMEKLLRASITITDDDLRLLALQRANVVKSYIVDAGPVEPERLFIIEPRTGEGKTDTPQVEMTIK